MSKANERAGILSDNISGTKSTNERSQWGRWGATGIIRNILYYWHRQEVWVNFSENCIANVPAAYKLWVFTGNCSQIFRKNLMWAKINTAGHHRHVFCSLTLLRIPFRRMKRFFWKHTIFSKLCYFLHMLNFFWILQKLSIQVEKFLWNLWNNIIWYAFYSNFGTFTDFEKIQFFLPKHPEFLFFKKKPQIS